MVVLKSHITIFTTVKSMLQWWRESQKNWLLNYSAQPAKKLKKKKLLKRILFYCIDSGGGCLF